MNTNLQNVDMSNGIGLLNSHTLPQDNKSSNLNEMNMSIGNCDVNGGYCYMNISTVSESNIHNYIYYTKKREKISPKRYLMEKNGLLDGVGIDAMLPASTLDKYANMEYNNEPNKLLSNGNI